MTLISDDAGLLAVKHEAELISKEGRPLREKTQQHRKQTTTTTMTIAHLILGLNGDASRSNSLGHSHHNMLTLSTPVTARFAQHATRHT